MNPLSDDDEDDEEEEVEEKEEREVRVPPCKVKTPQRTVQEEEEARFIVMLR